MRANPQKRLPNVFRTEQTTGYTFTLSNGQELSFTNGKAIIPAGTYTLSATNAGAVHDGYGGPLYSGSSDEFTLSAGEQKEVVLNLGSPKNAKVTIELSEGFTGLYTLDELTLNDGTRDNIITLPEQVVYFPAPATNTTLSYTLVANAIGGTHVQDITGATGTVTIAPGTHTTLTLDVNPITGYIKIETGGEHNGVFE